MFAVVEDRDLTLMSVANNRATLRILNLGNANNSVAANADNEPGAHASPNLVVAREMARTRLAFARTLGANLTRLRIIDRNEDPAWSECLSEAGFETAGTRLTEAECPGGSERAFERLIVPSVAALVGQPEPGRAEFIGDDLRRQRSRNRQWKSWALVTAALAIALLPSLWKEMGALRAVQAERDSLAREIARREAEMQRPGTESITAKAQPKAATEIPWAELLGDWERRWTDAGGVWIDRLRLLPSQGPHSEQPLLAISGHAIDCDHALSFEDHGLKLKLKNALDGLARSPFVRSVRVDRLEQHQPGMVDFDATIAVANCGTSAKP
ncbi:MAG TPA: hypothetical protein VHD32_11035 [Candidatus Didemnitutus sp.]|nr:hypothetical protein [Candidatus Didemnitutus sp.]